MTKNLQAEWDKYGLQTDEVTQDQNLSETEQSHLVSDSHHNELFAEDQSLTSKPWWKTNFFISEPILFGVWDGVFTACMINILGVIVFLRSGWIVGEAGIGNAILIVVTAVFIILASVFAGIGICERCPIERGGVYFLLSHVLGGRIGAAIGIVYCFGQAVSAALHCIGFGEAIGRLLPTQDIWIERAIALSALFVLFVINIAGVIWVIKLQFILLIVLLLATLDFAVGSFVKTNPEMGVDGYYSDNFWKNSKPAYDDENNWFTVFGVFFPTMTGIFAGINMSGDLRNPSYDIPVGTLSSISVCSFLYLVFIFILGTTCQRNALLTDYLIAEKVSAIGVLFLSGLYISSVSTCLAALYGAPRVLQSIAKENAIPFLKKLATGSGPNQVPKYAILVITILTVIFILMGQINTLAPLVTMPFLLTYAFINYGYFSLAMTYDQQKIFEQKFKSQLPSPTFEKTANQYSDYGTTRESSDLDKLFPERNQLKHKSYKQTSSVSSSLISSPDEHSSIVSGDGQENEFHQEEIPTSESVSELSKIIDKPTSQTNEIGRKSRNWYSIFCNRWIALLGAVVNIFIMFLVHWLYTLLHLSLILILYVYIGRANCGLAPGIAKFRLFYSIKMAFQRLIGKKPLDDAQVIVAPLHPGIEVETSQLNEDNEDYASRAPYHHSASKGSHQDILSGK